MNSTPGLALSRPHFDGLTAYNQQNVNRALCRHKVLFCVAAALAVVSLFALFIFSALILGVPAAVSLGCLLVFIVLAAWLRNRYLAKKAELVQQFWHQQHCSIELQTSMPVPIGGVTSNFRSDSLRIGHSWVRAASRRVCHQNHADSPFFRG